jgi:hypothetical protein
VPGSSTSNESHIARDKYSSSKSISSDQFFGRDEEDAAAALGRLEKYSSSTSISSDMINGNAANGSNNDSVASLVGSAWSSYRSNASSQSYGGGSASSSTAGTLGQLKDSVAGFFDDIQKRIG